MLAKASANEICNRGLLRRMANVIKESIFKNLLIKFVESSVWEESGYFLHRLSKFFGQAGFACIPPLFALHL